MLHHWIWLAIRPGIGDRFKAELVARFHDPEQIYFASRQDFSSCDFLTPQALESLEDKDLTPAREILEECTQKKIHLLTLGDAAYPSRLKNIPDPPVVLYYKGQLPDLDSTPVIGVVGTRKASGYGMTVAKRMGYQIAACGGIVVSGLAKGIDGLAMQTALTGGMPVVGVLGCGADVVYPPGNKALFADVENYGCILTEFPPGTPPYSYNFPRRNRIISGLSDGVLVIEAPEGSGALITARRALDQGRDVFAVPSNIDVPTGVGSNALLRDGAAPVASGWDILSEYAARYPGKVKRPGTDTKLKLYPDELPRATEKAELKLAQKPRSIRPRREEKPALEKKVIDNGQNEAYIDLTKIESSLSDHEKRIVEQLKGGQKLVDDVIADSGLGAGLVLSSLTLLEVRGIVHRLPGRYVALTVGK